MAAINLRALTGSSRRLVIVLVVLALVVVWHWSASSPAAPATINFATERVVVYERAVHDEVNGAIARSLKVAGIVPVFICSFRYKFEEVLGRLLTPVIPQVVSPYIKGDTIEKRLENNEIDTLILTTCNDALPRLMPLILASKVNVICTVHHSGPSVYHGEKKHIAKLIHDKRIAIVTLGDHVRRSLQAEVLQWAENEQEKAWLEMPVLTLAPTFDEPGAVQRFQPQVFPSRVAIQGNIESGRRRYPKVLNDLKERMLLNPALWGYSQTPGKVSLTRVNSTSSSPFSLHLVGQKNKDNPVKIPEELEEVVEFHENLPYPEFYQLLASMDLMVPAFAVHTTYTETASSSMAASVISRTPVLVTERHLASYTYIQKPGYIQHSVAIPEVHAIETLRTNYRNGLPRASDKEWETYQNKLEAENVEMWRTCWEHFYGTH